MDQHQTERASEAVSRATVDAAGTRPFSLCHVDPLGAGPLRDWPVLLDRVASLGFSAVLLAPSFARRPGDRLDALHPALAWEGATSSGTRTIAAECRARGLGCWLDVVLDRVDPDGAAARAWPDLFAVPGNAVADPRLGAPAALARPEAADALAAFWGGQLADRADAGLSGFRLLGLGGVSAETVAAVVATVRGGGRDVTFLASLEDVPDRRRAGFRDAGFDYASVAVGHDGAADERLWDRVEAARAVAAPLACMASSGAGEQADGAAEYAARVAVLLCGAWMMPLGLGSALPDAVLRAVNAGPHVPVRPVGAPGLPVRAFAETGGDGRAVVLVNDGARARDVSLVRLAATLGCAPPPPVTLRAGELRRVALSPASPIRRGRQARATTADAAARGGRVALERVEPAVDDGRFAAKRRVGETVTVEADLLCDGHDKLAGVLQYRPADEMSWREARMAPAGNDRWAATFDLDRPGRWLFRVQAWRDGFATYRDELAKKNAAGLDLRLELLEGVALVAAAVPRHKALETLAGDLGRLDAPARTQALLSPELAALMAEADERPLSTTGAPYPVDADRVAASFASWYEIFPRSMSDDPARHGTFRDVIGHLPRIEAMGFDVLYFPPIHPIGRTNRKGRNNALRATEDDPGSPYAIGNELGGHDAVHPELGTLADFQALREAAEARGLELALDFAIQCAPDHPWLREHPGWFAWRPDGSMRYAENPPKKYEDIVNVDFHAKEAVPALWVALCEVVLFWAGQGVRTFRVDNPHTKPFAFWEWLIDEVRAPYPDAVFLAEAFTRPKIMNRLAKLGFTQSYTYFTWRNTKRELEAYLTELAGPEQREFFRPNFFVNTPDINPPFLQTGGRAAHLIRATLAATLSGLWGVYSGFELCEATPVPGKEEYLDSEKYQLRAWDWERPGNIVADITRLNRIRRRNPALQTHLGVTFLPAQDDDVLFFEKATADRDNVVLVAVSLDPRNARSAAIELPLWRWSLPDHASLHCDDLLRDTRFTLAGKWQRITLTPDAPAAIWRARPAS